MTVYPVYDQTQVIEICAGASYAVGDSVYTETGVYGTLMETIDGCDSLVTLDLTVHSVYAPSIAAEICDGDTYTVGTTGYTTTGVWVTNLQTVEGCDSIVTLDLTVYPAYDQQVFAEICDGESYQVGDSIYTIIGSHPTLMTTINGCDSLVTLDLIVYPVYNDTIYREVCSGSSVWMGGEVFSIEGVYTRLLETVEGCDSLVTLDLTVHPKYFQFIGGEVCDGDGFAVGDSTYYTAGNHQTKLKSAYGCDSTVVLNLTVHPLYDQLVAADICDGDSYAVGDSIYLEPGIYSILMSSVYGCDSLVTLSLTVNPEYAIVIDTAMCEGEIYTIGGNDYLTSGTITTNVVSEYGCDSIVTTKLTVHPVYDVSLVESICEGDGFLVGPDSVYTEPGIYVTNLQTAHGCDSIVTVDLSVITVFTFNINAVICGGETYFVGGEYQTLPGIFYDTLIGGNGCPQYLVTTLAVSLSYADTTNISICSGESYFAGGANQMMTGIYSDTLRTINDCDSILVTALQVLPTHLDTFYVDLCQGYTHFAGGTEQTEAGIYIDVYSNIYSCDSIVVTIVEVLQSIFSAGEGLEMCEGDSMLIGNTYYTEFGFYGDTLVSSIGCDSIVVVKLDVNLSYEEPYTEILCEGDSILIGNTYQTEPGTYNFAYTTSSGCDSIVTILIETEPSIELIANDEYICLGASIDLFASGSDDVNWSPSDGLSCTDCIDPIVSSLVTTTYTITTVGCKGELTETTMTVFVSDPPEVNIEAVGSILKGEKTTLFGFVGDPSLTLTWYTDEEVICVGCTEIEVSPDDEMIYYLSAENGLGCSSVDQVLLRVDDECNDSALEIPNIISPNGDGFNDEFEIRAEGVREANLLRIYNRWGELIFESTDLAGDRWDGTFRGKPLNPGVYVYYIEGVCLNDDPFTKTGNVTVLK
ncbi:MAG: gliding motility-associated-like protein [Gammaproteobacteria bacterium]